MVGPNCPYTVTMPPNAPALPPTAPSRRRFRTRRALVVGTIVVASVLFIFLRIHPFLAVNAPIPAKIMVVEGWVSDYAVAQALETFRKDNYDRLYTTGGPLRLGSHLSEHKDYAHVAAATFERLGLPAEKIEPVPSPEKNRNRTFLSAVALKHHWDAHGVHCTALNLVTEGTHARRSRFCFQRALGANVAVGVISIENQDYSSDRWWRYSSGVKTILGETIAILYAWISIDYGD